MSVLPPLAQSDSTRPGGLRALAYPVGDAAVIAVEGSLDAASAPALDRAVTDALKRGHRILVLDLCELRRVDPDGVGVLWAGLRAAARRGGTLATAGLRASLRPAVDPLVPHGLRLYDTVRTAISASHGWQETA